MPSSNWQASPYKVGVTYTIENLEDSIGNQFAVGANTASVYCFVPWAYRNYFVQDMLGRSFMIGSGSTRSMVRILPELCPFVLDGSTMLASLYAASCELVKSVTWTGDGPYNSWPVYTTAVYKVTFASVLYPVKDEASITSEKQRYTIFTPRGESVEEKVPGGGYRFVDDAVSANRRAVQEVGTKTGRLVRLECKWLDVPEIPYANLLTYSNKVNDAILNLDGVDYAAETVMFETWEASPRMSPLGQKTYDITYHFLIRSDGRSWNKYWSAAKAKSGAADPYVKISSDGTSTGKFPYTPDAIQKVFQFAP